MTNSKQVFALNNSQHSRYIYAALKVRFGNASKKGNFYRVILQTGGYPQSSRHLRGRGLGDGERCSLLKNETLTITASDLS